MAILSFCLGAASVVAAAYAHRFVQERREARKVRLLDALAAVADGHTVTDRQILSQLREKGWVAEVPEGWIVTVAGKEFLAAHPSTFGGKG
ncbi:MAG: hypothetical protein J5861_06820 [Desulfovibrio sp.]|nr:hypothetical protein [Desulfovibrio sp.]